MMADWTFSESITKNYRFPKVWEMFGINDIVKKMSELYMTVECKLFDFDKSMGLSISSLKGKKTGIVLVYDPEGQNLARRHGIEPVMLPMSDQDIDKLISILEEKLN